jgi:hypothetical protein
MKQNETKRSKRAMWSVHVFVRMGPMSKEPYLKFLYLNVTKMYSKDGILHIWVEGKREHHMHDCSRVESVQAREYDRSGRIE